jgi:hypothetical protein
MRTRSVIRGWLCTAAAVLGLAGASSAQVVISQVYPGGGGPAAGGFPAATFISDFIELKNLSDCPISLSGWSIQYSAGTATTWTTSALNGTIEPGGYFLIQAATPTGFVGTRGLPFPVNGGLNADLAPAGGKVALVRNSTTALTGACPISNPNIVDFFGWGTANCAEGTARGPLASNNSEQAFTRLTSGCLDANNNASDFGVAAANPRNTRTAAEPCTTPVAAQACCNPTTGACLTVVAAAGCPAGFNAQPGCCLPTNPCPIPLVACCLGDSCFAGTSLTLCTNVGGVSLGAVACTPTSCGLSPVRISQIFGGGDVDSNAGFNRDFVELYNASDVDIDLENWTLNFASNTTGFTQFMRFSNNTQPAINPNTGKGRNIIPARGYYLISLGRANTSNPPSPARPALPRADWIGNEADSAVVFDLGTSGKLALVTGLTSVTPAQTFPNCPGLPRVDVADYVGFGAGPNCAESAPTGINLTSNSAVTRKGNGCIDTGDNFNDFIAPLPPTPRNSSSPTNPCDSAATGACCTGATCTLTTAAGCGGQFQGATTTCSPNNPCTPPTGRCCLANGNCTIVTEADCQAAALSLVPPLAEPVSWTRFATCTPNLCLGACCTGTACTVTGREQCTAPGTYWVFNITTCNPGFCTSPTRALKGDLAYGAGVTQNQDAVWHIRGAANAAPAGTRVGTWSRFDSIQSARFDNTGGLRYNARGNLLGTIFGSTTPGTGGGTLVNLATDGSTSGQILYRFGSTDPLNTLAAPQSRLSSLAISPNNQFLAVLGFDNSRVYIFRYNAGPNPGSGSGATLTQVWTVGTLGGLGANDLAFSTGFNQGAVWLNDSTLVVAIRNTNPNFTGPAGTAPLGPILVSIPMDPVTGPGTPQYRLALPDGGIDSSRYIAMEYNPALAPYLFVASSAFGGATVNVLSVVDVSTPTWDAIRSIGYFASSQTGRELALAPDLNLYSSQFAGGTGGGVPAGSPLIDRFNLDTNANGVIEAIDIAALNDNFLNTSADFYSKPAGTFTASFNGLGIAASTSDRLCLRGATCAVIPAALPCTGGPGVGSRTVANLDVCPSPVAANNRHATSCYADFNKDLNVTIDDIFIYLNAWFASSPFSKVGGDGVATPTIDDIFIYLNLWFAGCV